MIHREKVVARLLRERNPRNASMTDVVLFFPNDNANPGMIGSWQFVGQHGEASKAWKNSLSRPTTDSECQAVAEALEAWEAQTCLKGFLAV